jgi:hypothetical protein
MGNARKRLRPEGAVASMAMWGAEFMAEPCVLVRWVP